MVILRYSLLLLLSSVSLLGEKRQSLQQLIADNYKLQVFEWQGEAGAMLGQIALNTCRQFNQLEWDVDRTNEVGLQVERILEQMFEAQGVHCGIPTTASGRKQSTGYPDLFFEFDGQPFYLEVKTFSSRTITSSQRTFYFTVSDDPKVTQDAFHLLVGFEIDKSDDTHYRILRYHLLDLRTLPCQVKVEYNASNRDLYGDSLEGRRSVGEVPVD